MPVHATSVRSIEKPWGVADPGPWGTAAPHGALIGELWFERLGARDAPSSLLLKVLLTNKALSVQVHPDDGYARSIGLAHGKTEAWYVLSAVAGAQVAVGLKARLKRAELRSAIVDGSIAEHLAWRSIVADDVIFIPAGTIHAIGAGLVLVEIQQNSNATFRILDPEHGRPLDIEHAVAAAHGEPAEFQLRPERISDERSLLVSTKHFVFERIELSPDSSWCVQADLETWLFCLSGSADAGGHSLSAGVAVVAEAAAVDVRVGPDGLACLAAYSGRDGPSAQVLSRRGTGPATRRCHRATGTRMFRRIETHEPS